MFLTQTILKIMVKVTVGGYQCRSCQGSEGVGGPGGDGVVEVEGEEAEDGHL